MNSGPSAELLLCTSHCVLSRRTECLIIPLAVMLTHHRVWDNLIFVVKFLFNLSPDGLTSHRWLEPRTLLFHFWL